MDTVDVVDAHCHLYPESNTHALLEQMDTASVDVAVILAVAPNNVDKTQHLNEFIADTTKAFPDRFIGFGSVHPKTGEKAVQELERFPDLGLKGVKLHPVNQGFQCDIPEMDQISKKCEDLGLPILVHSYFPYNVLESERLYRCVVDHPDTLYILAHMGGHRFLDCLPYCARRKEGVHNVYFEVSSTAVMVKRSPYTEQLKWIITQMGTDRVVFGSNYPTYDLVDALSAVDDLGLSFEESQHILGRTLYDLLIT